MEITMRVTVWNEYLHEISDENVAAVYPRGIHGEIAGFLEGEGVAVKTATLEQPLHGLGDEVLENTDVLIWWGHMAHHRVADDIVKKVCDRVLGGMGIIFLHSAHMSKPFLSLLGTTGSLKWRETGDAERLWTVNPAHPIAQGVPECVRIEKEEMYGEPFDIPHPEELVFLGWFDKGEVFRSGCCWKRGRGKIFYFQPGHETYPIYKNPHIQKIIKNAVLWAKPTLEIHTPVCKKYEIDEDLNEK